MKKNNPGCGCCGCWDCGTTPDSVAVTGDAGCCAYPNGTFAVGATTSSPIIANNGTKYDEATNTYLSAGSYECNWYWAHAAILGEQCKSTSPYYQSNPSLAEWLVVCQRYDYLNSGSSIIGAYHVRLVAGAAVNLQWRKTPTRRLLCVIGRFYQCYRCNNSGATVLEFNLVTNDLYIADSLSCGSLPATINHTSRVSFWENFTTATTGSTDSIDFGYNPTGGGQDLYTFSACAANASVAITYA